MKETFYALLGFKDEKKLEKKEGEVDKAKGLYYVKDKNGWSAYDMWSGSSIAVKQPTKEDLNKAVSKVMQQVKEIRQKENYLQSVINYREMVEDEE